MVSRIAGFLLEVGDEGFNQFLARPAESLGAAEVGSVGLNQIRIEVVLADQKTKFVAQSRLTVVRAIWGL
jgi:hypothetical protein